MNHSLLPPGSRLLVAVSGGADSVALLQQLHDFRREHRWHLTVAHLNHGIRGMSAGQDARFVTAMAQRLRVSCVVGKTRVPALAKRRGISLEMAAREARYAFLTRTARKVKANIIVTAHTADDQVETILLKLLRGAGRGGLSGIAGQSQVGGIPLVRPLLGVARVDIEASLRARNIEWREDESNRDTTFLRNRIRHELIPVLERDFNPRVREVLLRSREVLQAEDEWMDDLAMAILEDCTGKMVMAGQELSAERLGQHPLAARRRVIRLWLVRQGIPEAILDFDGVRRIDAALVRGQGSETIELAAGWRVQREYDRLKVMSPTAAGHRGGQNPRRFRVKVPGTTVVAELGVQITVTQAPGLVRDRGQGVGVLPACASLNAGTWAGRSLWIRLHREGDRIAPYGMTGNRKIQDILVDAKIPRMNRPAVVVLDCDGSVIWLPGYRIARDWAVENRAEQNLQIRVEMAHNPLVSGKRRR